jgi:hypothetical protein
MAGALFKRLLEAVLENQIARAEQQVRALEGLGIQYELVQIVEQEDDELILGFMEQLRPGERGYRGWGAALVRPAADCKRVYQAPHVRSDAWSELVTLRAFMGDRRGCAAMFAGASRNANDGYWPSADVAHGADNLFHMLTYQLARRGRSAGSPYWFIQFHGSAERMDEPTIIASDGAREPQQREDSPLVLINNAVDRAGFVDMGVCGWREGPGARENGAYRLCACGNAQGQLLDRLELRHTFLHFEIAWWARSDYAAGCGPGYEGVRGLLAALREVL